MRPLQKLRCLRRHAVQLGALFYLSMASLCAHGAGPGMAATVDLCDAAADRVSRESRVPRAVLMAITRTETGRAQGGKLSPWPWTVNMEGKGRWFDSRAEAFTYVETQFKRGARSFDVGCFQINYKWHGSAFASIDQMFDPVENARYAAKFLTQLYDELGDWSSAAGAYHSRTPQYAKRYRARFDRIYQTVAKTSPPPAPVRAASLTTERSDRENRYPLLRQSGQAGRRGSLVPLTTGTRALFDFTGGT